MENGNRIFRLGVTGGIGSGKTSVCRVFNVLGIPVFQADPEAKDIMDNDPEVKEKINSITGRDLYKSGSLDRQGLAAIIFNDKALLGKVNELVHPLVSEHFMKWSDRQDAPYVIMEAAILFESSASGFMDKIVTVVAPVAERIKRVMLRNNLTEQQVAERIRNQMDDDERIKRSDYVILNSENDMIIPSILKIHEDILKHKLIN
jgi:dephospho-CoA kinase